ncbi:hypothetical protein E4U36_000539 [Claviceps purpurea]|nr:hypothetical protein E4U36_000539 [Claviceps purpurea]
MVASVTTGRLAHGNTIKYIKMVASSNFGNVFSMLAAAAWLPFTWMMSIQLLAQNLPYDINLLRFVVVLGPTSSVIDILTFALNWFYYGVKTADNEEAVRLTQTHWFLQGRSRAALSPALSTGAMMVIGFAITWIPPIQRALNFAQPSPTFVGFLVAEREAHTPISVRLLSCDIGP